MSLDNYKFVESPSSAKPDEAYYANSIPFRQASYNHILKQWLSFIPEMNEEGKIDEMISARQEEINKLKKELEEEVSKYNQADTYDNAKVDEKFGTIASLEEQIAILSGDDMIRENVGQRAIRLKKEWAEEARKKENRIYFPIEENINEREELPKEEDIRANVQDYFDMNINGISSENNDYSNIENIAEIDRDELKDSIDKQLENNVKLEVENKGMSDEEIKESQIKLGYIPDEKNDMIGLERDNDVVVVPDRDIEKIELEKDDEENIEDYAEVGTQYEDINENTIEETEEIVKPRDEVISAEEKEQIVSNGRSYEEVLQAFANIRREKEENEKMLNQLREEQEQAQQRKVRAEEELEAAKNKADELIAKFKADNEVLINDMEIIKDDTKKTNDETEEAEKQAAELKKMLGFDVENEKNEENKYEKTM